MAGPIRVMIEPGKKKKVVASAFDWPGWDRDRIVVHTYGAEEQNAKKVGVNLELGLWNDPVALQAYRGEYQDAIRAYNAEGKSARTWTLQFCLPRTCYHFLDHAWELEDNDLTNAPSN